VLFVALSFLPAPEQLWYQSLGADDLVAGIKDPALRARALKRLQKEKARSIAEDIFPKIAEHKGEMPLIKDQLPTISTTSMRLPA